MRDLVTVVRRFDLSWIVRAVNYPDFVSQAFSTAAQVLVSRFLSAYRAETPGHLIVTLVGCEVLSRGDSGGFAYYEPQLNHIVAAVLPPPGVAEDDWMKEFRVTLLHELLHSGQYAHDLLDDHEAADDAAERLANEMAHEAASWPDSVELVKRLTGAQQLKANDNPDVPEGHAQFTCRVCGCNEYSHGAGVSISTYELSLKDEPMYANLFCKGCGIRFANPAMFSAQ